MSFTSIKSLHYREGFFYGFNFVKSNIDTTLIHTIIKNESNQSYLISILLNKTGSEGVVNTNKDAIALALNNSNSISLTDYLIKINKYLGSWVYQNIIEAVGSNIVIKKELTLDELHIKRHPNDIFYVDVNQIKEIDLSRVIYEQIFAACTKNNSATFLTLGAARKIAEDKATTNPNYRSVLGIKKDSKRLKTRTIN